jgi:hypothetical protein
MKQTIGIIGATGDLGSQLAARIKKHGFTLIEYGRSLKNGVTFTATLQKSDIVHICAPVSVLKGLPPTNAVVILHDSVMNTSSEASASYLHNDAAIAHMLMNEQNTVVVASDAPHSESVISHFASIGLNPVAMTIAQHDFMIARSQAPLALLCKTLLPYLYEQADKGLLTPSGQLLANTLRSRELAWTDTTIQSILSNPQLQTLVNDMQQVVTKNHP